MLVKKYSLNPTRISNSIYHPSFLSEYNPRRIRNQHICRFQTLFGSSKLHLGQKQFYCVFYHKNCDFYIWLFQTLLGQAPWKLFRSIWSILPMCTLLLFSSVNYIQMSDAATDFMPDIESSVKCLLYWDQNQRMGDRSALVTLLSQDLHPLLTGAQNETVMEHSLMLTMQKIVLPI